jgi:bifunctional non-homologous end joining protein LigD
MELAGVTVSHPDKQLFPTGETKGDLAAYVAAIAPTMLPHLADRPLNLQRYPEGIDHRPIFQQHAPPHTPGWVTLATVPKEGGTVDHVVAADARTLVWLAQQNAVTLHAWLSRADRIDRPDRMIVDLDPTKADDPDGVRAAAQSFGDLLRELGLEPYVMATGSRGYHVTVSLQRRLDHDAVRAFARDVGRVAVARDPDTLTLQTRKAKRGERIYVDVQRNAYAHTAVAPYSVRARPGGPVATPLTWDELADPATRPDRFTIHDVPARIDRLGGDPWGAFAAAATALGPARRRLDTLLAQLPPDEVVE